MSKLIKLEKLNNDGWLATVELCDIKLQCFTDTPFISECTPWYDIKTGHVLPPRTNGEVCRFTTQARDREEQETRAQSRLNYLCRSTIFGPDGERIPK